MRTIDHFMSFAVSLLPVVQFEHVKTLFESTQSQESKSEIDLHRSMRQCTMTHFMAQSVFLVFWVQSRQFLSPFPSLPFPFWLDLVIIVILSIILLFGDNLRKLFRVSECWRCRFIVSLLLLFLLVSKIEGDLRIRIGRGLLLITCVSDYHIKLIEMGAWAATACQCHIYHSGHII